MATCFLFTEQLNEEGCLSLSLDQDQISAPLAQRNFAEIKALQVNNQTIVVVPANHFSLHQIEFPWLADKKARAAIPFALEDRLAQNVDSLHFSFDRNHYQQGRYQVVVADNVFLTTLIAKLDECNLHFDILTLDWFALKANEVALMKHYLLVNEASFQGSLSHDLAKSLAQGSSELTIYTFNDSNKALMPPTSEAQIKESSDSSYLWIAERLQTMKPMNLCQGDFEHGNSYAKTKRWYQAALALTLIWLLSLLSFNALKLHGLNKDGAEIDGKIATIYHEFFPQAQQVISPKFRIGQLLKSNQNNADSSFWLLLDKLARTLGNNPITIEQFRFQNQTLILTLATKDFTSLEGLQNRLQQAQVNVKQTQASTRDGQVVGTLELSL